MWLEERLLDSGTRLCEAELFHRQSTFGSKWKNAVNHRSEPFSDLIKSQSLDQFTKNAYDAEIRIQNLIQ